MLERRVFIFIHGWSTERWSRLESRAMMQFSSRAWSGDGNKWPEGGVLESPEQAPQLCFFGTDGSNMRCVEQGGVC